MAKIYHVDLTDEERAYLLEFIKSGERSARKITRARILLLADEGKKDRDIAESLHTSVPTVQRTRKRFVEGGLDGALNERPRPGGRIRKKLDEKGLRFWRHWRVVNLPKDGSAGRCSSWQTAWSN